MERSMGVPLGRLFGTDIRATGGFFILLALCFYVYRSDGPAMSAVACIAIVLSLLFHEFGHVFAVRKQLGSESVVILWGLGGLCVHEPAQAPRQRIIISLMGPVFTAILAGVALGAGYAGSALGVPHPILARLAGFLVAINAIWLVFNILPIRPLDGGQALEAALAMRLGEKRARAMSRRVSIVIAGVVAGGAYAAGWPVAAMMAILLLVQNLTGQS
jgi:Zn-dependent protease